MGKKSKMFGSSLESCLALMSLTFYLVIHIAMDNRNEDLQWGEELISLFLIFIHSSFHIILFFSHDFMLNRSQ